VRKGFTLIQNNININSKTRLGKYMEEKKKELLEDNCYFGDEVKETVLNKESFFNKIEIKEGNIYEIIAIRKNRDNIN